jgi:hypothetical protein
MSYLDILVQQDAVARRNYSYDPRVAQQSMGRFASIEPFSNPSGNTTNVPAQQQVSGSHSDEGILQKSPTTVAVKRYVVMDTSQRDWVKQPNPYSNLVFTFGAQQKAAENPPVYANNPFVPTFAIEQQALSAPIPGIPNTKGWTLSSTPSNVSYPAYNSSLPNGTFIGYDTGYQIQPSGAGFGSVFTPCNVSAIRLVRAVMPQRKFIDLVISPGSTISSNIQTSLSNTSLSTFATYPYLMFYLNEYFGQYVGGNEPTRRSFSVMTQKQRQQINFSLDSTGQQFDYEPWSEEALKLQSPITNLQRVQISVTDPVGNAFTHNDTLAISLIQATSDGMYLKCFTPQFQYFSQNEIRIGDRITFYSGTLSNMMKSPIVAVQSSDKKSFIQQLFSVNLPILQLLDYVPDANGIYNPRDPVTQARTSPYVSSYNGFIIPNFTTPTGTTGNVKPTYPASIDAVTYTVLEPVSLVGSNLEFMNVSLQPVYTLELDCLQPDTSAIGGKIVL